MRRLKYEITALALALAMMAGNAQAQEHTQSRDKALAAFADDLARLQASIPSAQVVAAMSEAGNMGDWWDTIVKKAQDMKTRWDDNPYVKVTGFSIGIAVPPSIDVDFEFK